MGIVTVSVWYLAQRLKVQQLEDVGTTISVSVTFHLFNRRSTMKSSTQDNTEGKWHKVKGKIKQVAGKAVGDRDLEAEGKAENFDGKVQEKIGEIKEVVGK